MDPMREDIKPFENHDTVIEATVEAIEKPSFYGTTKMFLRLLAFVETRDGETQSKGKGGLWGVTMDQFNQVQRSGFLRKPHLSDVRREFGINFQQSTYKDLDKPLISALFSLLYLIDQLNKHSLGLDAIPNDASSHAEFYAMYYNPGQGAMQKFAEGYRLFLLQRRQTKCDPKVDIIFLLDGSGSIGFSNFQIAKAFLADLTGLYTISSDSVRVGLIVYENEPTPVFSMDQYLDKLTLLEAIENVTYPSGGTETGEAIDYATRFGFNSSFGARQKSEGIPRILIVLTDGQSFDDVELPAMRARMSGLNLFSIGIANANRDELEAIASSVNQVYFVDTFTQLSGITLLIRTTSCYSSALVDKTEPVSIMAEKGQLKRLQVVLESDEDISISFSGTPGNDYIIYASFRYKNPGPKMYDFIWYVSDGRYTVSTSIDEGERRKRQVGGGVEILDAQVLFMGIEAVNASAPITIEVTEDSQTEEQYRDLKPLVTALGNETYQCTADCTCTDARVSWEKESFDGSLPDSAKVTTSADGRQSVLQLDPSSPGYRGRYHCVIRSPRVIGSEMTSIEFSVTCLNNGVNSGPNICNCTEEWGGLTCDLPLCTPLCENGGVCTSPNVCSCIPGYAGSSCNMIDAVPAVFILSFTKHGIVVLWFVPAVITHEDLRGFRISVAEIDPITNATQSTHSFKVGPPVRAFLVSTAKNPGMYRIEVIPLIGLGSSPAGVVVQTLGM
jgi:receptor-type tyrosine-protein phosphatase Q